MPGLTIHDLRESPEWLRVTLSSIGDGVITTDAHGRVTFLNPVAQELTGWTQEAAVGHALETVFHIVNQETRKEVENPALRALREGVIVGLANHTVLIARDGAERPIDDSAAPIRSDKGEVAGAVLVFRDITERHQQDKLIRDSLAYAVNILNTLRHAFLVLDKDLRVVSANRSFYEQFQVAADQTEGYLVYELGNGQWNIPRLRELLEEILPQDGHSIGDFEVEHDFPQIGKKFMALNARRVNQPGNHSELILLVIEDITGRKKAEEVRAMLAAIVESSDDAIVGKTLDGTITAWNRGAEIIFGYTAAEAVGQHISLIIPDERRSEEDAVLAHLRRGESVDHFETVRQAKDGRRVTISVSVSPIKDAAGRIIGAAKVARDITGRKQMEQDLRDSEVRYRRLFQAAKDGILILDGHTGRIIDANAFMSALVGLEPQDLLGKELFEIGMYGDESENRAAFRELQRTKYLRHEHLPLQHRNGQRVEVEFVANVYHEDHKLVAQCNVRDISQRVAMEQKIKEQTEALADESRRKDEFLAMLSHELRNPLNPIRSAVHLLKVHERSSESLIQRQAREIIDRQVTNLTKLVSDLLEVSRVTTGRIRLNLQVVDLNQMLVHAVETASPLIEQRKHRLTLHSSKDPVWVNADATRIEEVFVNLLSNAAKFTDEGGEIEIWCEHPRGHNYAQVRVRDNGTGIDEKMLPRVFDMFTQADRSLARSAGGLGIGLSLAHRLVDLHGGTIEAKSPAAGQTQGSDFIVQLPLMPAPLQLEPSTAADEHVQMAEGVRVLVVDDNIDSVTMLTSSLRHMGYSVQSAYTGPDGLSVAQQWRPEIVLMDIGLPGLDGFEVARRLRSSPKMQGTWLVAVTGYGRDTDLDLAREAGFDAHLLKPVDIDEIERLLAEWNVQRSSSAAQKRE